MRYHITSQQNEETYPIITFENEDDLRIINSYRASPLINFEFVMETLKGQCEIEEITRYAIEKLFDAIYSNLDPLIQDAVNQTFK